MRSREKEPSASGLNAMPIQAPAQLQGEILGIIAGGGEIPALLIQKCQETQQSFYCVALQGEYDAQRLNTADIHLQESIGKAGTIIKKLQENDVRDLVIIGDIKRPKLFELKPDVKTAAFFAKVGMKSIGDDGLLKAMRNTLEREGFQLHGIHAFLPEFLMPEGVLTALTPEGAIKMILLWA